jgi:tetratricopeptide (TPR) repeat protein
MFSCKTENKSNEEIDVSITNKNGQIDVFYNNEEFKSKEAVNLNSDGVELAKKNEFNKAATKFLEALNIEPNNPTILNNLGNIEKLKNNYDKSKKYFEKSLIASDSLYFNSALNLGIVNHKTKDYLKSIELFEYVISKSPDSMQTAMAHYHLCWTYLSLNKCDKAKTELEESKKVFKNDKNFIDEFEYLETEIKNCVQQSVL